MPQQHPLDPASAFVYISSTCPECQGAGKVHLESLGTMPTITTCRICAGTGITSLPMALVELAKTLVPLLFPPAQDVTSVPANAADVPVALLAAETPTQPLPTVPGEGETLAEVDPQRDTAAPEATAS